MNRISKMVREVEFYLLVPNEEGKLKDSIDTLASEVDDIKKNTEEYD